jgi:hypothetical protein
MKMTYPKTAFPGWGANPGSFGCFWSFSVNEECHAAKGIQTCSCFEAQLKFVNFFILQQKMSQRIVFNLVFNEDSKMGSAIFVPFVF